MKCRMHIIRKLAVGIAAALLGAAAARAEVALEATANRQRIYIGESFILQVKISGADQPVEPDVSGIADAEVRLLDSREYSNFSVTIINGRMVREGFSGRVVSYEVTPRRAGAFRAGPVALNAGGRRLEDPGPEIMVTDITPQAEAQLALEASRESVLVDEQFEVRLRLRIRALPGRFAAVDPLFPNNPPRLQAPFLESKPIPGLRGPDMQDLMRRHLARHDNQPGLLINEYTLADDPFSFRGLFEAFGQPRRARFVLPRRMVEVDGQPYFEYQLELQYTPEEEGDYVFGPATFKGSIPVSVDDAGNAQGRDIFAVGRAVTVRVVPPPEAGRPVSFTGALGTNLQVSAALDCLSCNAGDPVRLSLTVAGQIRLDRMLPPKLSQQTNLLENFAVYDQTVQTFEDSPEQRRFVYTIRPRRAGMLEVPPLELAYFDTAARAYAVRRTAPVPLEVRPGAEITADQIIGATAAVNGAAPDAPDADLPPAPPWLEADGAASVNLFGRPLLWIIVLAGPVGYMLVLTAQQYAAWRRQRQPVRLRRRVLSSARRRLRSLDRRGAAAGEAGAVCDLIRAVLAARFEVKTAALTPKELEEMLARIKLPAADARMLASVYQRHFEAAYGGAPAARSGIAPAELRRDCRELEGIIRRLRG